MVFVRVTVLMLAACVALLPDTAAAYRPFDGTDAAVADPGELEIEFQPAGVRRTDDQKTLIAPATVINYGFAKHWELVLESQLERRYRQGAFPTSPRRALSSSTCYVPVHFRTKPVPASRPSSASCCQIRWVQAVPVSASPASSRNVGSGARRISTFRVH